MTRNIDAKCRLCRREGAKLFLKGERCYSPKCPIDKKGALPPGQHGQKRAGRLSDYGIRLREKQKAKRIFDVTEKTFKNYYKKSSKFRGETGKRLLQLLETRLDNVLFKGGLLGSRTQARQLICHGFCLVDGKRTNIPSYQLAPGQIVTLNIKGMKLEPVKRSLAEKRVLPVWLKRKATVVKLDRLPEREEMEQDIDEQLIIEFYSK
ncbi:30S ribosomal protein S4 [Patescibacteria group bacterium]